MELRRKTLPKSSSCQVYKYVSSCSDSSTNSSSENLDSPLKRFNRLLRASVARHWAHFKKDRASLRDRGRSVSYAGLCSIVDHDRDIDIPLVPSRRFLQVLGSRSNAELHRECLSFSGNVPTFFITSAGGGSGSHVGIEEASDSDAERPRRSQHLKVPNPALVGQSTGNFAAGGAGGGCGVPRSAPATPLQLEPPSRTKHEKQAIKPLSGSAPSVHATGVGTDEAKEAKQPSKARQKKFQRHFPQVGPEERVLNYYSCALVGDLLLQGHLYITKNYFAFYSNVFGYVTKLLIPTATVLRITKEKVARIIPNAVGVCTRDERHVFGSLLSRDSTYKLMTHVWKSARTPELVLPNKSQDLRASEVELDASEYSPEDDSSSAGGGDRLDAPEPPVRRESEAIITTAGSAVIQPALLTGSTAVKRRKTHWRALLIFLGVLLAFSAAWLSCRLYLSLSQPPEDLFKLSQEEVYSELVRWRARMHGRAASELHSFLSTNLLLLTKVRQSLEALSDVILTDMAQPGASPSIAVPADTVFS